MVPALIAVVAGFAGAAETAAREPVLGVSYPHGSRGHIALHDPVTLRAKGRAGAVPGYLWDWDRAPGGGRVAVSASNRGRILIYRAGAPRRGRRLETGRREAVRVMRWATRDRLVALAGRNAGEALEIDVPTGRVVSRRRIGGNEAAVARTRNGLAVVVGRREADAELLLLRAGDPPRRIALPGVRAFQRSHVDVLPGDPPDLVPGLAVDGGVAYVAPAGPGSIVRVDLASGATTTHAIRAAAAKGGASRSRGLQVLGGGRLLLAGADIGANGRTEAAFTRVVDTAAWTARTLSDRHASTVGTPAGILIARFEERTVTVHDTRGRRIARLRPRHGVSAVRVHGRYAYVGNNARSGRRHRTHVIDLRTGRRVRVLPFTTLPHLLVRP